MQKDIYKTDFGYDLPDELIAKYPSQQRTESKTFDSWIQEFSHS